MLIDWPTGVVLFPWFNRRLQEEEVRPVRPQFRRADFLALFNIAVVDSDVRAAPSSATAGPPSTTAEIEQEVFCWYRDDFLTAHLSDPKPPQEHDVMAAAKARFPKVKKLRDLVRVAKAKHAPEEWKQSGPRPSHKISLRDPPGN